MAENVIQDVSVNIGATTADFDSAVKRVLVGNDEIQRKLQETAAASKRYADEQARSSKRLADAEAEKAAKMQAGAVAVQAATEKVAAANAASLKSAQDEAAARARLQQIIDANADKTSVAAVKRAASAQAEIERSVQREQARAAAVLSAEQELTDARARLAQIPLEQDQRISRMRESEAQRLSGVLVGIENRMAGLYNRNQATLTAALEREERERNAAARAAQREAEIKERAEEQAALAAEETARRIAAAKAREIAAAEAAAAKQAAAAFRAAEAQEAAAAQAMRSRQFAVQNMSFQVADVFTQAQYNGWGRAVATQAPQMLGGFGMYGAIAGAAVAALAPLALAFMESGDEAEKADEKFGAFEEQVQELASSVDELRAANDAALEPLVETRKKYGELTDQVIEHRKQLLELRKAQTLDDTQSKITGFRDTYGDPAEYFAAAKAMEDAKRRFEELRSGGTPLTGRLAYEGVDPVSNALLQSEAAEARFQPLLDALEKMRASLGLTEEQALSLYQQFDDVTFSAGPEKLAGQFDRIRDSLESIDLSSLPKGLADQLGEIREMFGSIDLSAGTEKITSQIADIQKKFESLDLSSVPEEMASRLRAVAEQFKTIDFSVDPNVLTAQLREILETLSQSTDATGNMTSEALGLSSVVEGLVGTLIEQTTEIGRSDDAAANLGGTLSRVNADNAIASVRELTGELMRAQAALRSLELAQIEEEARLKIEVATEDKPVERAGMLAGLEHDKHAKVLMDSIDPGFRNDVKARTDAQREAIVAKAEALERLRVAQQESQKAEQEAERVAEQNAQQTKNRAEAITDSVRTSAEKYREGLAELQRLRAADLIDAETYTRAVKQLGEEQTKAGKKTAEQRAAERDHNAALNEAEGIYDSTRTAAEAYGDELDRLKQLHAAGYISADTYSRAVAKAGEAYQEASKPPVDRESERAAKEAEREQQRLYNEAVREAEGIYDSTRTAAEKYKIEVARLDELLAAKHLDPDTYARAIKQLKNELGELGDVQATIKDGAREAFSAILTGAGKATDALANMASRLAEMFADRAFDDIWASLSGGAGGGFGGLFGGAGGGGGGLFSGLLSMIPGFAGGTDYAPGGLAMVGELGRELVRLPRGSQVIPNGQTEQLLRSAGGARRIEIDLNTTPEFEGRIRNQAEDVAIRTTQRGIADYDRNVAPVRRRQIEANPRRIG